MTYSQKDFEFMAEAVHLAALAQGKTRPNPQVGAVLVKNGKIVGRGFHKKAGTPHAEIHAIQDAAHSTQSSTLYVTLEPCCHTKKRTPPCVKAVLAAGIKKVYVAQLDPNPQVSGKGVQALRQAGIEVQVGLLKQEAELLNPYYNFFMKRSRPYIILKMATSLDGKVALANGKSQWITCVQSRKHAHQVRSQMDAILVGRATVEKDNPSLTARKTEKKLFSQQPLAFIFDASLKSSSSMNLARVGTILFTSKEKMDSSKAKTMRKKGVEFFSLKQKRGTFDLDAFLSFCVEKQIHSLLIEGGPRLQSHFVQKKLIDEIHHYQAPILLGGDALSALGSLQIKSLQQGFDFELFELETLGTDLFVSYRSSL